MHFLAGSRTVAKGKGVGREVGAKGIEIGTGFERAKAGAEGTGVGTGRMGVDGP